MKLECPYNLHYVSLNVFDNYNEFEKELETKRYTQNSHDVASYVDVNDDTLNVVVFRHFKNVTLYHSTDENKNLKIPCDGTRVNVMQKLDDDDGFHKFGVFIFHDDDDYDDDEYGEDGKYGYDDEYGGDGDGDVDGDDADGDPDGHRYRYCNYDFFAE